MDRVGQSGYMQLTEDGAVVSSSGDLENDENTAVIIMGLINLTSQIDFKAFPVEESFKKLSIIFNTYSYNICLSNKKIYISKIKKTVQPE